MKKLGILIALTASLTMAAFAGGRQGASGGGKAPLLLWLPPFAADNGEALDREFWTRSLSPWAEENNVNLSIEITPWANYEENTLPAFPPASGRTWAICTTRCSTILSIWAPSKSWTAILPRKTRPGISILDWGT